MVELAGIIVLGFFSFWIGWKLKIPSILPLIVIGLLVGPISVYFTPDHTKLIDGDHIFQKDLLFEFISISVGLILFEGGLTLKLDEVKKVAPVIRNLIVLGSLLTLGFGASLSYYLLNIEFEIALLFGALIIVSGPTVVGPILRNVKPNAQINTILKWESILIDPVGALTAILIYEFLVSSSGNSPTSYITIVNFLSTVGTGLVGGIISAFITKFLLEKERTAPHLKNFVVLAIVILTIGVTNSIRSESGLLAVTVAGVILANVKVEELKSVISFKEEVRRIAIAILFILLSSRINISDVEILGTNSFILLLGIILIIRPLVVFLSTINSACTFKEKIFIAWISPRGIVAAGVASVFTFEIIDKHRVYFSDAAVEDAKLLLPLTFMVILGTVIIQSLTAKPLAKALNVVKGMPNGVLIIGANETARFFAKYMQENGIPVLLSDTSKSNILQAKSIGIPVHFGSILVNHAYEKMNLSHYGVMIALTSNTEINMVACSLLKDDFGLKYCSRLASGKEIRGEVKDIPNHVMYEGRIDSLTLAQAIRKSPIIKKKEVHSLLELRGSLDEIEKGHIALFVHTKNNRIKPINRMISFIQPGDQIIYIDK